MMNQADWHQAISDLMSTLNAVGDGATLHRAISEYHGKPYNKKLNFLLICGGCASKIYFAIDRIYQGHLNKTANPPAVSCPHCNHVGNHAYDGIGK